MMVRVELRVKMACQDQKEPKVYLETLARWDCLECLVQVDNLALRALKGEVEGPVNQDLQGTRVSLESPGPLASQDIQECQDHRDRRVKEEMLVKEELME